MQCLSITAREEPKTIVMLSEKNCSPLVVVVGSQEGKLFLKNAMEHSLYLLVNLGTDSH